MGVLRVLFIFTYLNTVHNHMLKQDGLYALDIIHYNDFHARCVFLIII